jgi:hypothetical protein
MPGMSVPEATGYEQRFARPRKHEVRFAQQIGPVKPVSESPLVDELANLKLGLNPS